jgi:hypothetical protein
LRPASEREELLEFFLGGPKATKELGIFQGLPVPWVVMNWMTLAVKSRIWQLGKEKNEATMGIAPTLRHRGKRPVNPNPGNTRMDPFVKIPGKPNVDGKVVKMPGWLTKGLKKHGGPKFPKNFLGK